MWIMDRYLLRLFVKVMLILFVSLVGLYIVIDGFNNLDEFLAYGKSGGGLFQVLYDYYGARVLTFFDVTSGLLSLTAAMFAITWLRRTNELTAIMAAGVSPARVVRPLLGAVVIVSLVGIANRELLIPKYREKLARNAQDWLGKQARAVAPRYDNRTDILLGGRHTFAAEQRIEAPRFGLPPALSRLYGRHLVAKDAVYEAADGERPGGYRMRHVASPANIDQLPSATVDEQPLILTHRDTPWLNPGECFVVSDVDFQQLAAGRAWRRHASSLELITALRNPSLEYGPDVRVAIHSRLLQPFLDLTLVFLGLPLVLSRENRNIFVAAGIGLLVVGVFFLVTAGCHALGNNGYLLSPAQAAWGPLVIFVPIAFGMCQTLWE